MEANKSRREGQRQSYKQTNKRTQAGKLDTVERRHSGTGPKPHPQSPTEGIRHRWS